MAVGEDLHLDVPGPGQVLLDVALGPPEPGHASDCAAANAAAAPSGDPTTRIPRPPPPNAALMATGQPCAVAERATATASASTPVLPGTPATPTEAAA